jgi:cation:H+ antiporter
MTIALALLAGLVLLVVGGELLVRGSVRVAEHMGLSPLIIGLTLVGFGTSMPELVTSVEAASRGAPGIAIGNIVGSNIANILLILGISALLMPMAVAPSALKRDGVILLAAAILFFALAWALPLDRPVGVVLLAMLAGYLVFAYLQERRIPSPGPEVGHTAAFDKGEAIEELLPHLRTAPPVRAGLVIVGWLAVALAGLVVIVIGGRILVDAAVTLAREAGISESVIGLTIVAIGTSLPELVTSVMAAIRKHSDVAIGNVLGSNIYNTLGIGGVTAVLAPTSVPDEMLVFDLPVMIGASVLLLIFATTGRGISRGEGAVLFAGYGAYLWMLWPS